MMNMLTIKKILIGLIGIFILISCANEKQIQKNIKLKGISNQYKIGYETDSAIIYIGQLDAIDLTKKLIAKEKDINFKNDFKSNLDRLEKVNSYILVIHWQNQKDTVEFMKNQEFAGFIDQWLLKELILKGKTEIWNKNLKKFEEKIIYHFIKDMLGGETCYFNFKNGTEFHRQVLLLGE